MNRFAVAFALFFSTAAFAGCEHLYPNNTTVVVGNTTELCNSFYVSRYDESMKAVVLTSSIVRGQYKKVKRVDSFRQDTRVKKAAQVEPEDYKFSGFDKGHMVPAGDASNDEEMYSTFLMTNMTPQHPSLNRVTWRELEYSIRSVAWRERVDIKVITGALYAQQPKTVGDKRVPIPSGYFKIAYFASGTKAYYASNNDDAIVSQTTVENLSKLLGVDLPQ